MSKFGKFILKNKATLIMFFVPLVLGTIFYIFPYNQTGIQYSIQNYQLFKDYIQQIDGMQIFLDRKEVKNLTVSNIAIWNSGRSVIEREDIPTKSPLAIKLLTDAGEIITAKILGQTNTGNDANINIQDTKYALIDFDYLNKNDGFVLQIIHTENNITDANIFGEIKGIGPLRDQFNLKFEGMRNFVFLVVFFIIFAICVFKYNYYLIGKDDKNTKKLKKVLMSLFLTLLYLGIAFFLLHDQLRNPDPSSKIPYKISVPNNLQNFFISSE